MTKTLQWVVDFFGPKNAAGCDADFFLRQLTAFGGKRA